MAPVLLPAGTDSPESPWTKHLRVEPASGRSARDGDQCGKLQEEPCQSAGAEADSGQRALRQRGKAMGEATQTVVAEHPSKQTSGICSNNGRHVIGNGRGAARTRV